MSTKTKQYAHQSLGACGFAVMNSTVAYRLRPDLWSSAQECGFDFKGRDLRIEGAGRVMAIIPGVGTLPVLTRSTDQLAQRIEWVTGFKVEAIEDEKPEAAESAPVNFVNFESHRVAAEKESRLRALAAQEPPAHDCTLRRDILAARRELEQKAA